MDTDVIVVGSGPTGLLLAGELTLAGVDVIVLEKLPARTGQAKALNLQPRSAEVLDLRGLLDAAHEKAMADVPDGHFAGISLDYRALDTRHRYQVGIPQRRVEETLEARLAERGVLVRYDTALTALVQDEGGVTATAGGAEIRAKFLVGCDGGRSAVRRLAGIEFPGTDADRWGVVADVVIGANSANLPSRWRSMKELFSEDSLKKNGGLIPLDEPGLYRFAHFEFELPADPHAPVPADRVVAWIKEGYGADIEVREVRWASGFGNATRQAARYRAGRVLLAGDAAHIHLPAGGQGMNLGLQDAMNLGWKLAAEINGWAPDGLLDSYHAERHAVGAGVLANTQAQAVLMEPGPAPAALRKLMIEIIAVPAVNRRLADMISGLDIRYPMAGPDHPLLGFRLPDADLVVAGEKRRASEFFHPGRGVLLTADPALLDQTGPRVDAVLAEDLPGLDAAAVLVRPDGYVCWVAGGPGNPVGEAVATWFGPGRG